MKISPLSPGMLGCIFVETGAALVVRITELAVLTRWLL